jgi:hypothetical protein
LAFGNNSTSLGVVGTWYSAYWNVASTYDVVGSFTYIAA